MMIQKISISFRKGGKEVDDMEYVDDILSYLI